MKRLTIFLITFLIIFMGNSISGQTAASVAPKSSDNAAKITATPLSGYIWDTSEIDKIEINTSEDPTNVVFTFDDFQLWATVKGAYGDVLGEFYLPDADVVTLSGTGDFVIELHSKGGSGSWSIEVLNQTDYDLLYNFDWDELANLFDEIVAEPLSGYLADKYEIDRMEVDTLVDSTNLVFSWDDTMNLFAKIYGEEDNLLATYDLSEGNVVELIGTGLFTLHIYTTEGYGDWSCEALNKEDYDSKYSNDDVDYNDAKEFVNSFLKLMVAGSDDDLMLFLAPSYFSDNYISTSDYEVNKYYPVDFIIDSYDSGTGIVKVRIWGEDKGWIHGLDFKVIVEDGDYYLYPSSHSDSYVDPWHNSSTYLD